MGSTAQGILAYSSLAKDGIENIVNVVMVDEKHRSIWLDSRAGILYVAVFSIIALTTQLIFAGRSSVLTFKPATHSVYREGHQRPGRLYTHFLQYGSLTIATFKILRALSTFALLVATVMSLVKRDDGVHPVVLLAEVLALSYAVVLAVLTIVVSAPASRILSGHATLVTLAFVGVYAYRDIWPLLTYTLKPQDGWEGQMLWVKIALAVLSSVIFPVVEPYPYIPLDPEESSMKPNPAQTASILSFVTFWFMGPVIKKANRVPHLPADQLPPLMDTDTAPRLAKASAKYLDPHSGILESSNIYWGLVRLFPKDWIIVFSASIAIAVCELAGPVGINRLLNYLETNGENAFVRPWVWVVWIGLSPLSQCFSGETFNYYVTQLLVKTEATITATVIEHSLRICAKPESKASKAPASTPAAATLGADPTTSLAVVTTQDASSDGSNEITAHSQDSTAVESEANTATPDSSMSAKLTLPSANPENSQGGKDSFVGRINNLVTSDAANIWNGCRDICAGLIIPPVAISLAMAFLYVILGWSAIVGLVVMIVLMPVPTFVASLMEGIMGQKMKATDERVGAITETMAVIRMVKLFGWETKVKQNVAAKRSKELNMVWRSKKLELLLDVVNHILPLIHMVVTYLIYTLVMKRPLSASIVFSARNAFEVVRFQINTLTSRIPNIVRARVSIGRFREFLHETEMLDRYTASKTDPRRPMHYPDDVIGFNSATFAWSSDSIGGVSTPSRRDFRLDIDGELLFHKNTLNLIIGPTGSGKTSLLMALLGEMRFVPSHPNSWFNLPRVHGVAYAAQESWVLNATIRDNILFGAPYDPVRYGKAIHQCGLERDVQLFEAGDATEVGEKGITLSGGQKARITLARAVYSSAGIVLLDDVLAALDVHTARWVVDKCFKGDLLRGRTVLLVTHNVALVNPIADFVVALGTDGRILSQGSLLDALEKDSNLVEDDPEKAAEEPQSVESKDVEIKPLAGKLILEEETAVGQLGWPAFKLLMTALGGHSPTVFWASYLSLFSTFIIAIAFELWWLAWWARQYENHEPSSVKVTFYLGIYGLAVLAVVILFVTCKIIFTLGSLRASKTIHNRLVASLIGSTFRWLDVTPLSRMITRCTQDIQAVDDQLPMLLWIVVDLTISMFISLGFVVLFSPAFIFVGVVFGGLGFWIGRRYMRAQLPVKRELSKAKAPVLATVDSVISGLSSIRAYGAEDQFRQQAYTRINQHTMIARTTWNLNRWIAFRAVAITAAFTSALGWYLVYGNSGLIASNVGFALVQGMSFSEKILFWIRMVNEFQTQGNSLERIQAYLTVEQEPGKITGGEPSAHWPTSGNLSVEKLTARYSPAGPKVLHNISFEIKSGQRVGVVGRTGSGKSSLTLSLLRCIYTDGNVLFDGISTRSMNLDALRSKITIIPQTPELMSGTLRRNLDMFEEHDDAVLNDALRAAGLFSLQIHNDETKLSLDSSIASGGSNLSVGQRQIIALARALVRQSKLLILDEATSAIDYETDTIIQTSLRKELGPDVTVITIAHRLQTIMDSDKIMVLDAGKLVEFDSPRALLQKEGSLLRLLVDESADKVALYAIAEGKKLHL